MSLCHSPKFILMNAILHNVILVNVTLLSVILLNIIITSAIFWISELHLFISKESKILNFFFFTKLFYCPKSLCLSDFKRSQNRWFPISKIPFISINYNFSHLLLIATKSVFFSRQVPQNFLKLQFKSSCNKLARFFGLSQMILPPLSKGEESP
jgi:hypothetical protein